MVIYESKANLTRTLLNSKAEIFLLMVNGMGICEGNATYRTIDRFPAYKDQYVVNCRRKIFKVGKAYLYRTRVLKPAYIVSVVYKYHYRCTAWPKHIMFGLEKASEIIDSLGASTVATIAVGTRGSAMKWEIVKKAYETVGSICDVLTVFRK